MTVVEAVRILGVSHPWTLRDVKTAFRRRARETHPDLGGTDSAFKEVAKAFHCLEEHLQDGLEYDVYDAEVSPSGSSGGSSEPDMNLGAWFDVVGIRCANRVVASDGIRLRAQIVQIQHRTLSKHGEVLQSRWFIAVYAHPGIELLSDVVEVVLLERGVRNPDPMIFVRTVVQRSYDLQGRISAFWFDPLDEPVISEEDVYPGRRYVSPKECSGYYWWDAYYAPEW